MDNIFSGIKSVGAYLKHLDKFEHIDGYLSGIEGFALMQLAEFGPGQGEVVEIGSMCGLSTSWLASGIQRSKRGKVYAVDHFQGSPEHQPGQKYENKVLIKDGSTFNTFCNNLGSVGLLDWVEPIQKASLEAVQSWDKPIRLLFIDGDHSYEATKADYESWSPFVSEGGLICFHDIDEWAGCTRFYNELMENNRLLHPLAAVGSLRVVQVLNR